MAFFLLIYTNLPTNSYMRAEIMREKIKIAPETVRASSSSERVEEASEVTSSFCICSIASTTGAISNVGIEKSGEVDDEGDIEL